MRLGIEGGQSHLHHLQLLVVLLLLLKAVVHVVLLQVVLAKGDVVVVAQSHPGSSPEGMVFLGLAQESRLALDQRRVLFTYHRVSLLLVLSWAWDIGIIIGLEPLFLSENTIGHLL